MEEEISFALILRIIIHRRQRRRQYKRRYWVHPLLSARLLKGQFNSIFTELRDDHEKFYRYFRISARSFDELLCIIRQDITGKDTNMRLPITPEEKSSVTLRYLGTGCSFSDLHFTYRIGISTASKIVHDVCKVIWCRLRTECIPFPSENRWLQIAEGFEKSANFPNCIGAIDGKHIRIIKAIDSESLFFNYKHFCSTLLLAVCDSNYCFSYVDVGSYGKSSDSGIFSNYTLCKSLKENSLNIPGEKALPGLGNISLPHVLVGDEGFGLSKYILRLFGGKNLTTIKKIFNYRLTRARRYIECTFGIYSNKWRIFHRPLNVSVPFAEDIVKACCLLHNFVRVRDGYNFDDMLVIEGLYDPEENEKSVQGGRSANDIRDKFAEYFLSPQGEVPWQYSKI